jgi:hypothetical protein
VWIWYWSFGWLRLGRWERNLHSCQSSSVGWEHNISHILPLTNHQCMLLDGDSYLDNQFWDQMLSGITICRSENGIFVELILRTKLSEDRKPSRFGAPFHCQDALRYLRAVHKTFPS